MSILKNIFLGLVLLFTSVALGKLDEGLVEDRIRLGSHDLLQLSYNLAFDYQINTGSYLVGDLHIYEEDFNNGSGDINGFGVGIGYSHTVSLKNRFQFDVTGLLEFSRLEYKIGPALAEATPSFLKFGAIAYTPLEGGGNLFYYGLLYRLNLGGEIHLKLSNGSTSQLYANLPENRLLLVLGMGIYK